MSGTKYDAQASDIAGEDDAANHLGFAWGLKSLVMEQTAADAF